MLSRRATKNLFIFCLSAFIILAGISIASFVSNLQREANQPPTTPNNQTVTPTPVPTPTPEPVPTVVKKDLATIKFYSQAPFGVWDALHEDTCEEASVLMVYYWFKGLTPTLEKYDQDLKDFVSWEERNGYGPSVNSEQLKKIAQDYLQLTLEMKTIETADDMIALLNQQSPIIFPADGRILENPHYTDGGPPYHMLVVSGYESGQFITEDPGTRHGENFRFSGENLLEALGNWTGTSVDRSNRSVLFLNQ